MHRAVSYCQQLSAVHHSSTFAVLTCFLIHPLDQSVLGAYVLTAVTLLAIENEQDRHAHPHGAQNRLGAVHMNQMVAQRYSN